jgi:hypothetical protein
MSEFESKILNDVKGAIDQSIKEVLTKYDSPLNLIIREVIETHKDQIKGIIDDNITNLIESSTFKDTIKTELSAKLAKVLVSRFGGELESQVNKLKADPTTRAKITLAINSVVESLSL